jgi:flagellar protein FliO/FliZ
VSEYLWRLGLVLPLTLALAFVTLRGWHSWRTVATGGVARKRRVEVKESVRLGTSGHLAVVEFDGRSLLLSVTKAGIALVTTSEGEAEC